MGRAPTAPGRPSVIETVVDGSFTHCSVRPSLETFQDPERWYRSSERTSPRRPPIRLSCTWSTSPRRSVPWWRSGPGASRWTPHSLFLRPDGLLIGYLETPSIEQAQAGMAATEVNARWQAEMAEFFVDLGDARPDTGFVQLEEVFHLEDQLAALESESGS